MRLFDAYNNNEISRSELLEYLDQGFKLDDDIPVVNHNIQMITTTNTDLNLHETWTIDSDEVQTGYIGYDKDMTVSGHIVNNGEVILEYNNGNTIIFTNTGKFTNTGLFTLREYAVQQG